MADGPFDPETGELIPRDPSVEDLVSLCRELHAQGAKFMLVGGFSIRAAGCGRLTIDIDILIDTDLENEARVYEALAHEVPRRPRKRPRRHRIPPQYFAAKGIQPPAL